MPTFEITAVNQRTGQSQKLLYNSDNSTLTDENYVSLVQRIDGIRKKAPSVKDAVGKTGVRTLKVQLGLSCNFSCEYCSQRFVPHSDETHREEAEKFVAGMDAWLKQPPENIEFWGGEPFVYWKTLKPLAESLRKKFPDAIFSVITNGSILDEEKVDWLDRLGFSVSISHDGPGQHVRGPDPLDDPETRAAIMLLYRRLAPQKRFSFNSMLNRSNTSRAEIQRFFEELVAPYQDYLVIGEGAMIDAYDEGGAAQSLTPDEAIKYRNLAFTEIRTGQVTRFKHAVSNRVMSFVNSFRAERPISAVEQKCGMDQSDNLAVDLRGNVLTCQNVSAVSRNPAGISHKLGHVSDLASVRVKTSTHWSDREECPKCPMLHICQGSCLFLTGPLWEKSCDNAYADAVPIFAAGIEFLTGFVPIKIEGPHRSDRHDIWGMIEAAKNNVKELSASRNGAE